ncbi:tyrosine-type recombinase/integrase [Peribacillus butanolivorans]|uniref:hypothetical protein n=1 Tax=Peribacillus butanolivorans TaxID=421767 RepID=UPI0036DCF0C3
MEKHITPYFGLLPLQAITTKKLDDFYNYKLGMGLSSKTIREFHNLLRNCI